MTVSDNEYHFPPVDQILTDVEVFRIAGELREDRGSPELALALMGQFVAAGFTVEGPSRELVTWVRDALADHLAGKSLDAAFRIKRGRRGRPRADQERTVALAVGMLSRRVVDGLTFEAAAQATAEALGSNRSAVCEAFEQYKVQALHRLCAGEEPAIDVSVHRERLAVIFPWSASDSLTSR